MSAYEHPSEPRPHECRLPGEFRRWLHRVRPGTIWTCDCGRRWEWRTVRDGEVDHRVWRAGEYLVAWEEWVSVGPEVLDAVLGPVIPMRGQRLGERA